MKNFFAVLGGMGSVATESYVRQVNKFTHAHSDQEYLDYVVFNHASVPDRTAYILDPDHSANPVEPLLEDIEQATQLGASFIALTCNTAHYFYDTFQNATNIPILHMPRIAVEELEHSLPATDSSRRYRVGFLGTEGSLKAGIYQHEIEEGGYEFVRPDASVQADVNHLIYEDIKANDYLNEDLYRRTVATMFSDYGVDAVILGCTELSVLAEAFPSTTEAPVIDAQLALVFRTIEEAKKLRLQ